MKPGGNETVDFQNQEFTVFIHNEKNTFFTANQALHCQCARHELLMMSILSNRFRCRYPDQYMYIHICTGMHVVV